MKKKLTPYTKRLITLIIDGAISTLALLFAVLSAGYLVNEIEEGFIYLPIACFFMILVYLSAFFFKERKKLNSVRNLGLAGFYLILFVLAIIIEFNRGLIPLFALLFFGSFIYEAIVSLCIRHKVRNIVFGILKILLALLFILLYVAFDILEEIPMTMLFGFVPLFMAIIAFAHAMVMVFSGVRKTTIIQILKKTYSIEILYGLIVLIVATSLVLMIVEENMSLENALWYCFALVTTIGFGDVTVTSFIGRILSVVLGIYGIIVVALITSIIVNFYNETKHEHENDNVLKEEMKQLDEQRKPEETEDKEEPKE